MAEHATGLALEERHAPHRGLSHRLLIAHQIFVERAVLGNNGPLEGGDRLANVLEAHPSAKD